MKLSNHSRSALKGTVIAALLLPLTALAQPDQHRPPGSATSVEPKPGQSQSNTLSTPTDRSQQAPQYGVSVTATDSPGLQRVSEKELKQQLTADRLIGKKVKDRSGETIGKVKDIGLGEAVGSAAGARYSATTTPGRSTSSASIGDARTRSTAGSTPSASTSTTTSATGNTHAAMGEVKVFIEVDDADAIVAVRASELRFDEQKDEVTLQRSKQEITQFAERKYDRPSE